MERLDGSETLSSLSVLYDGTGRPVREGGKQYKYGCTAVVEGDRMATYEYHADGQLARATYAPGHEPAAESFEWDGLALIRRGDEEFVNGTLSRSCIPRA